MAKRLHDAGLVLGYNPGADVARWHKKAGFQGTIAHPKVTVPLWKEIKEGDHWPDHPNRAVGVERYTPEGEPKDLKPPTYLSVLDAPGNRDGYYAHVSAPPLRTAEEHHDRIDREGFRLIDHEGGEEDPSVHVRLRFQKSGAKAKSKVQDTTMSHLPGEFPPVNTRAAATITQIAAEHLPSVLGELERQRQVYVQHPEAMARAALHFAALSSAAPFADNVRQFLALQDIADGLGGKQGRDVGFERLTDLLVSGGQQNLPGVNAKGQTSDMQVPGPGALRQIDQALKAVGNPQTSEGLFRSLAGNNLARVFEGTLENPLYLDAAHAHQGLRNVARLGDAARKPFYKNLKSMKDKTTSFATHLAFPDTPKVYTLDTHMFSLFDQAGGGPGLGGGFQDKIYPAAERWYHSVFDHHLKDHADDGTPVSPFAKQWATWDAMYGVHVPHEVVWRSAAGESGRDLREVWDKHHNMLKAEIAQRIKEMKR